MPGSRRSWTRTGRRRRASGCAGSSGSSSHGRDVTGRARRPAGTSRARAPAPQGAAGASRDELIDLLWPAAAAVARARARRRVVSRLRAALGPGVIVGRQHLTVQLEPGAVDVEFARAGCARPSRRSRPATSSVRAPPSTQRPTAHRPAPAGLEGDWIDAHRNRFEDVRLRLRRAGIQAGLGLGGPELDRVVGEASRLVEAEPASETAVGLLMRALAARGDRSSALEAYEALRMRLRDELGTTPSPKLASLHAELLQDAPSARTAGAGDRPIRPALRRPRGGARAPARALGRVHARALAVGVVEGEPGSARPRSPTASCATRPCCAAAATRTRSSPTSRSSRHSRARAPAPRRSRR